MPLGIAVVISVGVQQIWRRFDPKATFGVYCAVTFGLMVYPWMTSAAAAVTEVGAFLIAGAVAAGVTAVVVKLSGLLRSQA